jgi:hypothetical protein
LTERSLVVKSEDKTKIFSPLVTLSFILAGAIIIGTTVMPSEMVNGQNSTYMMPGDTNATYMMPGDTAELSGDNELPPVNTEANGIFTILGNNQGLS